MAPLHGEDCVKFHFLQEGLTPQQSSLFFSLSLRFSLGCEHASVWHEGLPQNRGRSGFADGDEGEELR